MDRQRVEGQEKHGLCRVSATLHPRPVHFSGSSWALGGHRLYLQDSLRSSRNGPVSAARM